MKLEINIRLSNGSDGESSPYKIFSNFQSEKIIESEYLYQEIVGSVIRDMQRFKEDDT